jgi:hypothetical protein
MPKSLKPRRGYLLVDALAAIALLAAGAMLMANLLQAVALQQRKLEQQTAATQLAANLLERELARPWAEVESRASVEIDVDASRLLHQATAEIEVAAVAEEDTPAGKRVAVVVKWGQAGTAGERSVRLSGWKFTREKGGAE